MKGPRAQYTNEMYKKFGYYATWEPNRPIALGDVGIFKNHEFTRLTSLDNLGIKFNELPDETPGDLEYSSQGSVTVTTKLAGTIPPVNSVLTQADAGLVIEFSNEKAVVFKANKTFTPSINDTIDIGNKVLRLYQQGKWNKDWVVITELVKAESATIIISNRSNSKVELKANAEIDAADFDIADAKFEFTAVFSRGLETKLIATRGITPLFKVMGLKSRWFLSPVFTTRSIEPMDLLTPERAMGEMGEKVYFGNIEYKEEN